MTAGLLTVLVAVGAPTAPERPVSPYHVLSRGADESAGRATLVGGPPAVPVVATPPVVAGSVHEPAFAGAQERRGEPVPYEPQPGDLVLFVSDSLLYPLLFAIAMTGEPYHAGIVVRAADGTLCVLEAGPPEVEPWVRMVPVPQRFAEDTG